MPSLLSIPKELLDRIIEIVVLTERTPPADVATAEQNRMLYTPIEFSRTCKSWPYGPDHVRYEKTETIANTTALLLANRQLHRETKSALRRIYPNGLRYKLDCIFLNEREILPTWTHVPAVSKRISDIDVIFRIFGTDTGEARSAFAGGDGGPPEILWTFYYLLEHFLECGTISKQLESSVAVDSINLDFVLGEPNKSALEDTPEGRRAWKDRQSWRRAALLENEGSTLPMRPSWLAEQVSRELQCFVSTGYHDIKFASIISERVGQFAVCSEGENICGIEVGQRLAQANHRPDRGHNCYTRNTFGHLPGECRILTFWNWKHQTVQLRKQLGLPLEEATVVWPTLEDMKRWREGPEKGCEKASNRDSRPCMCEYSGLEDMLVDRSQ